jgi:hypothetical protein
VRFTEQDVDQARAAGVLIEFERGRPIIVDRPLYPELVKEASKRTHAELQGKATAAAEEKKATRRNKRAADPVPIAKHERDAQLREVTDQAPGPHLDLGVSLIHHLAAVEPDDLDVARFFVYALLGADHDKSPYTQTGERIARLAAGGVRLLIGDLRTDVTKTRKDGSRGRLRYDGRPPRPAGRDRLAVEVHRRREDRGRVARPVHHLSAPSLTSSPMPPRLPNKPGVRLGRRLRPASSTTRPPTR